MSATLPRKSGGTRDDLLHARGAALREGDRAVPLHDVHRALDAPVVVLQRVVGPSDRAVGVREQGEVEPQLRHVARMGFHTGRVHTERLYAGLLERRYLIAHGGELAVSARGVVSGIEDQRDLFGLEEVGQPVGLTIRPGGGEQGGLAADGQEVAHEIPLRFYATFSLDVVTRCASSFSSHSKGTSSPPSGAGEWLGCRTSRPSRPCSWNCRIWPSVPWSPRWAATATPPTAWTSSATCDKVGSGFST